MKGWRMFSAGLVTGVFMGSVFLAQAAPLQAVTAYLADDVQFTFDGSNVQLPYGYTALTYEGRTYVPARFVAESLGAKVVWNEATGTVTITDGDTNIVLVVDSTTAYVNGKAVKMDASAFIADGRIFTPCRFVAEQLGANVEWDEATRTITIIQYAE